MISANKKKEVSIFRETEYANGVQLMADPQVVFDCDPITVDVLSISGTKVDVNFQLNVESSTYGDIRAWFPIIRQPGCKKPQTLIGTYISEGPMRGYLFVNFKSYQVEKMTLRGIEALTNFYLEGFMTCIGNPYINFNVTVPG